MEFIVIYSIVIFVVLILSLYLFLFYERLRENRTKKLLTKKEIEVSSFLDDIISNIDENEISEGDMILLKSLLENELTAKILTQKFIHYIESFRGTFLDKIIKLSEEIGLVDYQMDKLNTKNEKGKILAIKNLGELRSKKALKAILKMLSSSNAEQIYASLKAISIIGDEEYFIRAFESIDDSISLSERSLIEIADNFRGDKAKVFLQLINSKNDYISTIFIKAAGNLKDTRLLDEIHKFIDDNNNEKRIAAVRAFGNIGDNRYIEDIIKHLKSDSWELRATTAKVLGQLNDKTALKPLIEALKDSNYYVRRNAANSIISLEGGLEEAKQVILSDDRYAADILIEAIEKNYSWLDLIEYDKKNGEPKITDLISKHVEQE